MSARIIGAAMTRFARAPESSCGGLAADATAQCLADAGLGAHDVQLVAYGNAVEGILGGQEMIRGEVALRHAGFAGVPILNVENACASSSSAFYVACMAVQSGMVDLALAVGVEKLSHPDKSRSFAAVATAVDLSEESELATVVATTLLGARGTSTRLDAGDGSSVSRSPLMDLYALHALDFARRSGATQEDMALVAVKNRLHASLNPKAQYRSPVSLEEVLASRMIVDPLRLLMCAPVGDGAAAVLVASEGYARRLGGDHVEVRASVLTSNGADPLAARPAARAAAEAYERAGVDPSEIDVAEVHDACAPAELWLYEQMGWAAPGDEVKLLRTGVTRLGGGRPVNPSGGLLSKGHPLGATGCAQLVELTDQLRGRGGARQVEGARVALAQNGGGILDGGDEAAAVVTILST